MEVKLIALTVYLDGDSPEELIEHAGHVCYAATRLDKRDPGGFVRARIKQGHLSLTEHASATFEISGISRACSHQLVRHRLASYSQRSQRYCSEHSVEWVVPPSIQENPGAAIDFGYAMVVIQNAYRGLVAKGISKEDARFVLPNATPTTLVMSANLREWRHIIRLRTDPAAQWEIASLAQEILRQLLEVAPNVFGDLAAGPLDG